MVNKPFTYDPDAAISIGYRTVTLTLTYTAQILCFLKNLVININGTNDVPTIDSATNPAAIDR